LLSLVGGWPFECRVIRVFSYVPSTCVACCSFSRLRHAASLTRSNWPDQLIVPGFVDCHVHYPQVDIVGSYGEQLLEWLQNYVFPAEARYEDAAYADKVAKIFVEELLKSGTTTALTFCTVHPQSVDALFTAAAERNMLMIAGKVLMDDEQFAPDSLREDCHQSYCESKALIEKWHGKGRCLYAVTPRFAVSSTDEELSLAGQLVAEHAAQGVYVHTHLNENMAEIELGVISEACVVPCTMRD
jgi:guanine deaminase